MKSERESIELSRIIDFWIDKSNVFKGFIDLNEPTCWACGQGWDGRYDIVGGDYLKAWAKCPLQICHIIPHSLGGTEEPSNLVLMCKECHDLAPNTTIKEVMFKWMASQSWFFRFNAKLTQAFNDFDVPIEDYEKLICLSQNPDFKLWVKDKIGMHWPQSGYSGLGHKFTVSTYVGLLKYYSEHVVKSP
ncbi:HNH endonuclease [Vibrio campbellii]|uniref:HNH endonuclease n=1 Tax=Vibrio campbellii TaxID=680 RepID=UPI001315A158|nr:HNH endonuclease [Vibrio campbellii]